MMGWRRIIGKMGRINDNLNKEPVRRILRIGAFYNIIVISINYLENRFAQDGTNR